jgi:hypothetical protein
MSVPCFGAIWSGGVRHPDYIAKERFQERKGEIGRGFGHGKEGKRRWRRLEEGGTPDTWGHVVSDGERGREDAARALAGQAAC